MQDKIEFLFNEKKARAAAAFTLSLSGGALPLEKLQALLYIADRASLGKYATPITTETTTTTSTTFRTRMRRRSCTRSGSASATGSPRKTGRRR